MIHQVNIIKIVKKSTKIGCGRYQRLSIDRKEKTLWPRKIQKSTRI